MTEPIRNVIGDLQRLDVLIEILDDNLYVHEQLYINGILWIEDQEEKLRNAKSVMLNQKAMYTKKSEEIQESLKECIRLDGCLHVGYCTIVESDKYPVYIVLNDDGTVFDSFVKFVEALFNAEEKSMMKEVTQNV